VIGTSRTAGKLDKCKPYGLDARIAVGDPPKFSEKVLKETGGDGADVILDLVGAAYLAENQASLASRGHIILVGLTSGAMAEFDLGAALRKRATIIGTVLRPRSVEEKAGAVTLFAREVVPLLASARAKPNLDKVFPARKVVDAYNYLGSNKSFGKVVLEF
jgi:NADPH:quinone reductase-like Zn-dependent oxidoreductase